MFAEHGRFVDAEACYRQALAFDPDPVAAHARLGNALRQQGRFKEALAHYRHALTLDPRRADTYSSLGKVLEELGHVGEAIGCYREAITERPDFAAAHSDLARALLMAGQFEAGWWEHEWRWHTERMREARRKVGSMPQWYGEAAAGRRLLIQAEQGLGDSLQFCRYGPLAARRGLRVVMEVPATLVRLLSSLEGIEQVVASGSSSVEPDLHCPMLSLPLAFDTTLETIPAKVPYLHAADDLVTHWRGLVERAAPSGLRIGLVWAGDPRSGQPELMAVDRRRSLPPERLRPLFSVEGIRFFSLQKLGPVAPADLPLIDLMSEVMDFADTAALVSNLDLVLSVDTAVAHLAGSLGRPVWLMDRFDTCWRWLSGRDDSPWYPSLRIYRQPEPGLWGPVIASVRAALCAAAAGHKVLLSGQGANKSRSSSCI